MNRTLLAIAAYNAGPAKITKCRKLAEKMGYDPNKWFGNVEVGTAKLVGRETTQYVANIYKYHVAYRLAAAQLQKTSGPKKLRLRHARIYNTAVPIKTDHSGFRGEDEPTVL
jgi:membrane-bound lytic murein transglycosylase MltF